MLKDLLLLIEKFNKIIEETKKNGLTQYTEGKIDGINYTIRELEKLITSKE
jgi:hypothetical protein